MKSSLDISVFYNEKTIFGTVLAHVIFCYIYLGVILKYLFLVECILCTHMVFEFLGSWVQLQLQNHPAELWEDGIKDYLSHASEIMVSFTGRKWMIFYN